MRHKAAFVAIVLLTAFDAIATGIGVSNGYIGEGNPIANFLFGINIPLTCVLAFLWTCGLLYWIVHQPYKWIPCSLGLILAVKVAIAWMHLYWIAHVL